MTSAGAPIPKLQVSDRRSQVETTIADACERLLESKPFAQISIEDLASEAGIQRTAFYFYYANKEEVLVRLIERVADALYSNATTWFEHAAGSAEDLRQGLADMVAIFTEHATLFKVAVEVSTYIDEMSRFWRALVDRFIEAAEARIRRDQGRGVIRSDLDARYTAEALVWMAERVCYQYIAVDGRRATELTDELAKIWKHVLFEDS